MTRTVISGRRIALIGQLGTGKSFIAAQLAGETGAERLSFGREVYRVAEQVLGRTIDKSRPEDRKMLTDIGTHWGRNGESVDAALEARLAEVWSHAHGSPDTWINAVDRTMSGYDMQTSLVLDDLRFTNELRFLLDRRFCIFLVKCHPDTHAERLRQRGDFHSMGGVPHASEEFATWISMTARDEGNTPAAASTAVPVAAPVAVSVAVPVLWNDDSHLVAMEQPAGPVMTLNGMKMALRNGTWDGMQSFDENAAAWNHAADMFENRLEPEFSNRLEPEFSIEGHDMY